MTYYGLNKINLSQLTYDEFMEQALDLPKSLNHDYKKGPYDMAEAMSSPYAEGLGGGEQGNNFMPQILRELITLEKQEKIELKQKLLQFCKRLLEEETIHFSVQFEFNHFKIQLEEVN